VVGKAALGLVLYSSGYFGFPFTIIPPMLGTFHPLTSIAILIGTTLE
jgi:hypothetical protein